MASPTEAGSEEIQPQTVALRMNVDLSAFYRYDVASSGTRTRSTPTCSASSTATATCTTPSTLSAAMPPLCSRTATSTRAAWTPTRTPASPCTAARSSPPPTSSLCRPTSRPYSAGRGRRIHGRCSCKPTWRASSTPGAGSSGTVRSWRVQ
jgi:hypothetical protein